MVYEKRLSTGASNQQKIASFFYTQGFKVESIAPKGSILPDIVISKNSRKIQLEVKGARGFNESGTFDLSFSRNSSKKSKDNRKINELTKMIAKSNGYTLSEENKDYFTQYIDRIRLKDKTVGYVGDKGVVGNSGRLPVYYFSSSDDSAIRYALKILKDHLSESNDDYFCLVEPTKNQFVVFGKKQINNDIGLNIRDIRKSDIRRVYLKTYGATDRGKIRVSMMFSYNKSMFNSKIINI